MAFYSYLAGPEDVTLASLSDLGPPDLHTSDETLASVPDLSISFDETTDIKKARTRPRKEVNELCVICHNCRQWRLDYVICSRENCSRKFCSSCLLNRHGEFIEAEQAENVRWVCPRCRGGCGQGCDNCCHCSTCRKNRGLDPTGNIAITVIIARENGFTNVHDYMVHLNTEESPAAIANRKKGRGWTSIDAPARKSPAPIASRNKGRGRTSIDAPATTGGKAVVIRQEENVRWGKKKPRTTRFALATPKWGSGGRDEDLFDARIVLGSLGSNWEVGRKFIPERKASDCTTEETSPDSTGETEQSPNTESTKETQKSSQSESSFQIPDSEVLAVYRVRTKRLRKTWEIDENNL